MRFALLFASVLLLSPLSQASAQIPAIEPGDRVRLQLSRDAGEGRDKSQKLIGEVLAVTADSVTLQLHAGTSPIAVEIASIRWLERSLGRPSAGASALRQGALVGTAAAVEVPIYDSDDPIFDSVGQAALIGAAVGTAAGMIIGAIFPRERWERIQLPHDRAPLP